MANPIWSTTGGSLGVVPENEYFQIQLDATDPQGGNVTFRSLAGKFPPGLHVTSGGTLQGVPVITETTNINRYYEFSIRAQDQNGLVADRTFNLTVSNIVPPQIIPRMQYLGTVFDGSFYNYQLHATEVNPDAVLTWTVDSGTLPPGLSLSTNGLISGFILPVVMEGGGGDSGYSVNPYNEFAYENSPSYQTKAYTFTIRVFDGINYDSLTYTIGVSAKDQFEADTTNETIDASLTVDSDNLYLPIMITPSQSLPTIRSDSNFAFQFQAIDPNDLAIEYVLPTGAGSGFDQDGTTGFDTTGYDQETLSLPAGLILDSTSGWLTGSLGVQTEAEKTYTFNVYAREVANPTYRSTSVQYKMTILGDINNSITWTTNANLGIIDNGSISQLSITAASNAGKTLKYSLVTAQSRLPQGLKLLPTGLIVGRASFEYFSLDQGTTTIDGSNGLFDNKYTFVVKAYSTDDTVSSTQAFTVRVNNYNKTPYENIYLKALPTLDQRQTFLSIVNNTDIFPESLIYRPSDQNFGRARDIRSLFIAGLTPSEIATYMEAMSTNTYNKRIEFSNVKTARAVDANFNTKYEVVYVELQDLATITNPVTGKVSSPANVNYNTILQANVYPNSFENMSSVIVDAVGYANQGALPEWMTAPQADKKTLGFTRAIVLAYTIPGASSLIAYRLRANGISFNTVDFVADRYDLDNILSKNYNITTKKFNLGKETTFDRIVHSGRVVTGVDYGARNLSFSMIHNQTVEYIVANGGIDGVKYFNDGDTMIFLQQENYVGETSSNDGWNLNGSAIPGYNEFQNSIAIASGLNGFPTSPIIGQVATVNNIVYVYDNEYSTSGTLTGNGWKLVNQRGGVWQINISELNVVTLSFKTFLRYSSIGSTNIDSTIMSGDKVQVNYGISQTDSIVYYNPILDPGNSVPAYTNLPSLLSSNTKFDNYGTKFVDNRDGYTDLGAMDKYLKFPKTKVLQ
jgi:hypothetical protein